MYAREPDFSHSGTQTRETTATGVTDGDSPPMIRTSRSRIALRTHTVNEREPHIHERRMGVIRIEGTYVRRFTSFHPISSFCSCAEFGQREVARRGNTYTTHAISFRLNFAPQQRRVLVFGTFSRRFPLYVCRGLHLEYQAAAVGRLVVSSYIGSRVGLVPPVRGSHTKDEDLQ